MTSITKSSCSTEYSRSSAAKSAARISSLLNTAPPPRRASSRARVVLPVPGRPAIRTIIVGDCSGGENSDRSFIEETQCEALVRGRHHGGGCTVGGGNRGGGCSHRPFHGSKRKEGLRLAPVIVAIRTPDVETPVAPLFFRFDQAERVQIKQVMLDESHLLFGHAAALQVDRDTGEMRRRGIAIDWRCVAIVAPQFLLHRHGAHGGVQLDLRVKLAIIRFGKVLHEIASPGTTIAARGIEAAFNFQRLTGCNRHQFAGRLQRVELIVVLYSWQIEAVDFFVLPHQGIVGGAEQRVPEHAAQAAKTKRLQDTMAAGMIDAMQRGSGWRRRECKYDHQREQNR